MDVPSGRSYLALRPFISELFNCLCHAVPLADLSGPTAVSLGAMEAIADPACFNTPGGFHSSGVQADADENAIRLSEFNVRYWHLADISAHAGHVRSQG